MSGREAPWRGDTFVPHVNGWLMQRPLSRHEVLRQGRGHDPAHWLADSSHLRQGFGACKCPPSIGPQLAGGEWGRTKPPWGAVLAARECLADGKTTRGAQASQTAKLFPWSPHPHPIHQAAGTPLLRQLPHREPAAAHPGILHSLPAPSNHAHARADRLRGHKGTPAPMSTTWQCHVTHPSTDR